MDPPGGFGGHPTCMSQRHVSRRKTLSKNFRLRYLCNLIQATTHPKTGGFLGAHESPFCKPLPSFFLGGGLSRKRVFHPPKGVECKSAAIHTHTHTHTHTSPLQFGNVLRYPCPLPPCSGPRNITTQYHCPLHPCSVAVCRGKALPTTPAIWQCTKGCHLRTKRQNQHL